jgi:hypothetical protein
MDGGHEDMTMDFGLPQLRITPGAIIDWAFGISRAVATKQPR